MWLWVRSDFHFICDLQLANLHRSARSFLCLWILAKQVAFSSNPHACGREICSLHISVTYLFLSFQVLGNFKLSHSRSATSLETAFPSFKIFSECISHYRHFLVLFAFLIVGVIVAFNEGYSQINEAKCTQVVQLTYMR